MTGEGPSPLPKAPSPTLDVTGRERFIRRSLLWVVAERRVVGGRRRAVFLVVAKPLKVLAVRLERVSGVVVIVVVVCTSAIRVVVVGLEQAARTAGRQRLA